jgi:hypothetical protein
MDISKNTSSVSSLLGSLMLLDLMQYVSLTNLFTAFDTTRFAEFVIKLSFWATRSNSSLFVLHRGADTAYLLLTLSLPAPAPPSFARSSTGYEPNSLFGAWAPSASSSTLMSNEPGTASDSAKTTNANRRR